MIAITGASGRLGRSISRALGLRRDVVRTRLGSRTPEKLLWDDHRFESRFADFNEPESLLRLFAGSSVALIICGTTANETRIRQHRQAIDAAVGAGVGHVVYTSFVNPTPESLFPFAAAHADTEAYLDASGLDYTIVRNNHYFDNLSNALATARATSELSLPGAAGKVAYLSLDDIGEAFATLLLTQSTGQRTYELTGPEALDLFQVAERASRIWKTPVRASNMEADAYRDILAARGLPPFALDAQVGIRLACGANEYAELGCDLRKLINREPTTIDKFLRYVV